MTSPASIGERVRIMRLAANLSQSDLARTVTGQSEAGNKLISQIENGRQVIDEQLLNSLAVGLGCTPSFLSRPRHEAISTRPWLRAYADANARTVDGVLADDFIAHEVVTFLQLKQIQDHIPLFYGDLNDPDEIERFAEEVRIAADIPTDSVVGNAVRAAERLGCIILPLTSELGRHLGMSHRIDGTPFLRVSRPGEGGVPGDRQRFTVAHELGHLGLHAHVPPPQSAAEAQQVERQAHRFASAFLAPAHPLLEDWERLGGRVTLTTLAELKATWGLAIKALVVRFQQLGVIDSDQATSLYKQISKRGWNKSEPVATTNEEPIWLQRALGQKLKTEGRGQTLASAAARVTGLNETVISRWMNWTPVSPAPLEDPVSLQDRRGRKPSTSRTGTAEVTTLFSRDR